MREKDTKQANDLSRHQCDENCRMAIASALKPFATEMHLIDVVDLVAFVRTDQHANIEDLVKSSAELFFKTDTLRYSMAASVDLTWDSTPIVKLDLEFFNLGVWIYFTLVLQHPHNAVDVAYIEFSNTSGSREDNTARLKEALQDARVKPRF